MHGKGVPPTHIAPRRSPAPHTLQEDSDIIKALFSKFPLRKLSTFICLLSKPPLKKHPLSLSTPPAATPPRIQMHRGSQRHCRYGIRSIMLIPEFCWCDILVLTLLPGSFETCSHKGFFKELGIPIFSESCRF